MTASTVRNAALPVGATSAGPFDPEDGTRSIRADLSEGVVLWAEEARNGQLNDIAAMLDQGDSENGYSAARLRELIPVLERAAELADQWAGVMWTPDQLPAAGKLASGGDGTMRS